MTRRDRATWLERCVAVLIAALPLLGQLSGGLHMLAVEHVVCPVHGEWLHGTPSPSAADARELATPHGDETAPRIAPTDVRRHRGHDACELALAGREVGLEPDVAPAHRGLTLVSVEAVSPVAAEVADPFARYLLAPKQSPPA